MFASASDDHTVRIWGLRNASDNDGYRAEAEAERERAEKIIAASSRGIDTGSKGHACDGSVDIQFMDIESSDDDDEEEEEEEEEEMVDDG